MLDIKTIIQRRKEDHSIVNEFYINYKLPYYDMVISSYTRHNINVYIYREDLRSYFNNDSAVIYLPLKYKHFKILINFY